MCSVMSHPLIPQILQLAEEIAPQLSLEVLGIVIHTHKSPAVVRVDIRNLNQYTGLDDCERMSHALEEALDQKDLVPFAYVLEVSSPGIARELTSDREFIAFRGFTVIANMSNLYEGKQQWTGQLVGRDQSALTLSLKGKLINLPRELITKVELA